MSLSAIYADFVKKEEKDRDPLRLFVTDAGKCHRQIAYRLLDTEKDYVSPQAEINKLIMFDIAEYLEETLWVALLESNKGVDYQQDVVMHDRENWGGRFDIIADYDGGERVIEVKSLYPGAFKYDINYPAHQHQYPLLPRN